MSEVETPVATDEAPVVTKYRLPYWRIAWTNVGQGAFWAIVAVFIGSAAQHGYLPKWLMASTMVAALMVILMLVALVETGVSAYRDWRGAATRYVMRVAGTEWRDWVDNVALAVVVFGIALYSSAAVRRGGVPPWFSVGSVISFIVLAVVLWTLARNGKEACRRYRRERWQRLYGPSQTR